MLMADAEKEDEGNELIEELNQIIEKMEEEEEKKPVKITEEPEEVEKEEESPREKYDEASRSVRTLKDCFERLEEKGVPLEGRNLEEKLDDLEEKHQQVKKVKKLSERINEIFSRGHPEGRSIKELTGQEVYELPTIRGLVKGTDFSFSSEEDKETFRKVYKQFYEARKDLEGDVEDWVDNEDIIRDLKEEGEFLRGIEEIDLSSSDVGSLDRGLEKIESQINEKRDTEEEL